MSPGLRTATTKVAVADKQLAGGEQLYRGVRFRRVQGITSDFSDLRLRGEKWTAILGDNLSAGTLARTTKGASTLTLSAEDPKGQLMRNPVMEEAHQVELDGLKFVLVKVSRQGRIEPLVLTYEPLIVWELRQIMGPHKAFRDAMTRAEFAQMLAFMVKPHPVFISPELHKIQPIGKAKQGKEAQVEAEVTRDEGIGEGTVNLTAKGVKATPSQIDAGDRALRVAASLGAPFKARVAMMLALIVESVLGSAASNWYEAEPFIAGNHEDLEEMTKLFLTGYSSSEGGAIGEAESHPDWHAYEITQAVQRSGAGLSSNGAANYGPWTDEAIKWVEAGPEATGTAVSGTVKETKRYAYSQSKTESNWTAINRLAGEVHWDAFESAGWLYFLAEPSLLSSHRRLNVSDSTPWVIDTGFDYDVGKENAEMTVEALAKNWAAPPGSAVSVTKHGVADGDYIVNSIEAGLQRREGIVQITLRRPSEPLPEPAAESKTRQIGGAGTGLEGEGGVGGMGVYAGTAEDVVNEVVFYAQKNGFPDISPSSVRAANATHGPTVSGGRSDHQGPPETNWAADISNGYTTPEETHLAAAVAKAFGIPWDGAGLVTHEANGYRLQLIYKTLEGGDHYTHVHFGAEVQ